MNNQQPPANNQMQHTQGTLSAVSPAGIPQQYTHSSMAMGVPNVQQQLGTLGQSTLPAGNMPQRPVFQGMPQQSYSNSIPSMNQSAISGTIPTSSYLQSKPYLNPVPGLLGAPPAIPGSAPIISNSGNIPNPGANMMPFNPAQFMSMMQQSSASSTPGIPSNISSQALQQQLMAAVAAHSNAVSRGGMPSMSTPGMPGGMVHNSGAMAFGQTGMGLYSLEAFRHHQAILGGRGSYVRGGRPKGAPKAAKRRTRRDLDSDEDSEFSMSSDDSSIEADDEDKQSPNNIGLEDDENNTFYRPKTIRASAKRRLPLRVDSSDSSVAVADSSDKDSDESISSAPKRGRGKRTASIMSRRQQQSQTNSMNASTSKYQREKSSSDEDENPPRNGLDSSDEEFERKYCSVTDNDGNQVINEMDEEPVEDDRDPLFICGVERVLKHVDSKTKPKDDMEDEYISLLKTANAMEEGEDVGNEDNSTDGAQSSSNEIANEIAPGLKDEVNSDIKNELNTAGTTTLTSLDIKMDGDVNGMKGEATNQDNKENGDTTNYVWSYEDESEKRWYLIKWNKRSHWHNRWHCKEELTDNRVSGQKKIEMYDKRDAATVALALTLTPDEKEQADMKHNIQAELDEDAKIAERIIDKADDEDGEVYLVKWLNQGYETSTFEYKSVIEKKGFSQVIAEYHQREERLKEEGQRYLKQGWIPWNIRSSGFQRYTDTHIPYLHFKPGGSLRDYQLMGLNWVVSSLKGGRSVLLADEMGLGKTIQTVSTIGHMLMVEKVPGPYLVIVPQSTADNWMAEFKMWLPNANVVLWHGNAEGRAIIRDREMRCMTEISNGQYKQYRYRFDIVVATPSILTSIQDLELLQSIHWFMMAVDEAHQLKNRQSKRFQELIRVQADHKLLLSGTPLQNNIEELWTLLHFLNPHIFDDLDDFKARYPDLERTDVVGESKQRQLIALQQELSHYILRRVKRDVEKSLPNKVERILRVAMTPDQQRIYKAVLTRNYAELAKGNGGMTGGNKTSLQNICVELKKLCNHPFLLNAPEGLIENVTYYKMLSESCGKLILLDSLLKRLRERGHRVLIFSQMVLMLNLLSEFLTSRGYKHQRLDGTMPKTLRLKAMNHFNAKGSTDFCFLISTKAGGLGINLTTADTVIIYDSDWNPQNDLQAEARAHRIGQTKTVQIYRLLTKDSIEESVLERAKSKMVLDTLVVQGLNKKQGAPMNHQNQGLNNSLLEGGASNAMANGVSSFSREELAKILKFGAKKLWNETSDDGATRDAVRPDAFDLDAVLAAAEDHTTQEESGLAASLLSSFSNVQDFQFDMPSSSYGDTIGQKERENAKKEEDDADDGKNFWDSAIPKEERERLERERLAALHQPIIPRSRAHIKRKVDRVDLENSEDDFDVNADDDDDEEFSRTKKKGGAGTAGNSGAETKERAKRGSLKLLDPLARQRNFPQWFLITIGELPLDMMPDSAIQTLERSLATARAAYAEELDHIVPANVRWYDMKLAPGNPHIPAGALVLEDRCLLTLHKAMTNRFGHPILKFQEILQLSQLGLPAVLVLNLCRFIFVLCKVKAEASIASDTAGDNKNTKEVSDVLTASQHDEQVLLNGLSQGQIQDLHLMADAYTSEPSNEVSVSATAKAKSKGKVSAAVAATTNPDDEDGAGGRNTMAELRAQRAWFTLAGGKVNAMDLLERVRNFRFLYEFIRVHNSALSGKEIHNSTTFDLLRIPIPLHVGIQAPKWVAQQTWFDYHDEQLLRATWALGYQAINDLLGSSSTSTSAAGAGKKAGPNKNEEADEDDELTALNASKSKVGEAPPPSEGCVSHPATETRWTELRQFMKDCDMKSDKYRARLIRLLKGHEQHFQGIINHRGTSSTPATAGAARGAMIANSAISRSRGVSAGGGANSGAVANANNRKRIRGGEEDEDYDNEDQELIDDVSVAPSTKRRKAAAAAVVGPGPLANGVFGGTTDGGVMRQRLTAAARRAAIAAAAEQTGPPGTNSANAAGVGSSILDNSEGDQSTALVNLDRLRNANEDSAYTMIKMILPPALQGCLQELQDITTSTASDGSLAEKQALINKMKKVLYSVGGQIESLALQLSANDHGVDIDDLEVDHQVHSKVINALWRIVAAKTTRSADDMKNLYSKLVSKQQQ